PLPIAGFTKSMAWHERTHRDAAHQWLRNLVHETSQFKA
ncbi:LysR family transcriptional regulator, partial [Citrobacter youngae]